MTADNPTPRELVQAAYCYTTEAMYTLRALADDRKPTIMYPASRPPHMWPVRPDLWQPDYDDPGAMLDKAQRLIVAAKVKMGEES